METSDNEYNEYLDSLEESKKEILMEYEKRFSENDNLRTAYLEYCKSVINSSKKENITPFETLKNIAEYTLMVYETLPKEATKFVRGITKFVQKTTNKLNEIYNGDKTLLTVLSNYCDNEVSIIFDKAEKLWIEDSSIDIDIPRKV